MKNLRLLAAGVLLSCALVACDTVSPNAPALPSTTTAPAQETAPATQPQNGSAYPEPGPTAVPSPYPTP